jgi:Asp-tRNA(Asn)/Glu-tRNA(Gln) amidotransferase A subunit family amidase
MQRTALLALVGLLTFNGCSVLPPRIRSGSRAFISYWPTKKGDPRLRLALKDNIDMQGVVTTAGSSYLLKHAPAAKKDAACLAIARQRSDVQIVGKANMSEFAVAPSGFNEYFGTPKNPFYYLWPRIPGGSSSGSAVAVADDLADVAFGTDTAGSVRVPAACCGIVGLKTTRGLVPLKGVYPVDALDLDTIGPMGKNVATTARGMELLQSGFAERYATAQARQPNAHGIRVARLRLKGTNPGIDAAIDTALERAGFQIVRLPDSFRDAWEQAEKDGNTIAAVGIWLSYDKFGGVTGISTRTKTAILFGRTLYGKGYWEALARLRIWTRTLQKTLRGVDFIALPTLQTTPPLMTIDLRVGVMDARVLALQNTVPVNVAGNPALALPVPLQHADFPVTSLQLIGRLKSEGELLNAGRLVEAALDGGGGKKR